MKTLHKYLVREILVSLLMTVAVFVFVVLLFNVLKEILPLLVRGEVGLWLVLKAIGLLIPFACVYALPMGFITAALLVFGRFSADQELTAARASGISLFSLISPVLLLSLFCCALSAWFNMDLGPRSRVNYIILKNQARSELGNVQLPAGKVINDFPGYVFYTAKNHDGNLEHIWILQLGNETNVARTVSAPRGRLEMVLTNHQLILHLNDARVVSFSSGHINIMSFSELPLVLDLNVATNQPYKPKISDMTFWQLREELNDLEKKLGSLPVIAEGSSGQMRAQLHEADKQRSDLTEPVIVEMHRQIAFSFACFGFTLVGIPLGIRLHRRETNVGVAVALMLVLVYYAFNMLGESLSARPEFVPHLIFWLPNFIFQAVGAVLLWRANKGI
ncbi:MAG TPA: LptF/LptG family permease [Verrucomicrobiae bacterium]|nr:LptF/LptG family permease [Verrucomicrobiae bacterium]